MDSTFLTSLLRAKIIASRTYSFFWGIDSAVSANSRDGSLTIGGYDGAVLGDGASTTAKLNYEDWKCREGIKVNLTGLVIQSDGGGIQNILNSSEKLEACVLPTLSSVLWLPDHYWPIIADGMGVKLSTLNNGTSNRLFYGASRVQPNTSDFTGNLSITINNAVTVTIPNEQLLFDEPYIASDGRIKADPTLKNIPIVRYSDPKNYTVPRIGGMFFSNAYLMVNHDKGEFTIAPVQSKSATPSLMGIDTTNKCAGVVTPSSDNAIASKALSSGAIAGIVLGTVAALAILASAVFLVWRRKQVSGKHPTIDADTQPVHTTPLPNEIYGYGISELYAGKGVSELSGSTTDYAVELDTTGRP